LLFLTNRTSQDFPAKLNYIKLSTCLDVCFRRQTHIYDSFTTI